MSGARTLTAHSTEANTRGPLASWYAQGLSDGLGDRLLMFDNAATSPLELLRVRADFARAPEFEKCLRSRVDHLAMLTHRGIAQVRTVEHLDAEDDLTVVSVHVPGTRVSELLQSTRATVGMPPAHVHWMLGELLPALAALHSSGVGVAHGALTPERIVVTADHHVVITDAGFGSALERLRLSPERLWNDLGVVAASQNGRAPVPGQRGDVVQLGLLVLALVLGRRIGPSEYPDQLDQLMAQCAQAARRRAPELAARLCAWLQRALARDGFDSAVDAAAAYGFPDELPPASGDVVELRELLEPPTSPVTTATPQSGARDEEPFGDVRRVEGTRWWRWGALAFAIVAVAEGAVITRLAWRATEAPAAAQSTAPAPGSRSDVALPSPSDAAVPAGDASAPADFAPAMRAALPPLQAGAVVAASRPGMSGDPTAAVPPHLGGFRIIAPITVQVVDGQRVLGSSAAGPIMTTPGVHTFDLINNALGYRTRQSVRVPAGRIVPLRLEPPNGSLSVTAEPAAQVWVDGKAMGETPLDGMRLGLGNHEVLLRHPQFGQRRERVVVQAGEPARVSVTFAP